jgi:preprotein translocase subunit SecF
MQLFDKTNIDFVSKRKLFINISGLVLILGVLVAFIFPPEFGIDYTGGSEVAVEFNKDIHTDELRNIISNAGLKNSEIKSFGEDKQYLIRVKELGEVQIKIEKALSKITDNSFTILKVDKIGAKIGGEMRMQAFLAIILAIVAMLIYIGFRFEFAFGLGAMIALVHDVFIVITFIMVFNALGIMDLEINQSLLAALLTVVGYSVNDTVIVFDRVRENRELHKGMNFIKLINLSINETLSRTVNTVMTVVITLVVLLIFGGPVLMGFAFTLLVGILVGTYSSVYIASNFVIWYFETIKKQDLETGWANDKNKVKTA